MNKTELKEHLLSQLYAPYKNCTLCPLATGRSHVVFGKGNADASLLLIGEAPGRYEDLQGLPFVGRSGMLLHKSFEALHINEHDIYITNIVKCRPPNNRAPLPHETETCMNILLKKQIAIINPAAICTLGATAITSLTGRIGALSSFFNTSFMYENIPVFPTYHPAYILRTPSALSIFLKNLQKAYNFSKKIHD